jgi:hypothetical protein
MSWSQTNDFDSKIINESILLSSLTNEPSMNFWVVYSTNCSRVLVVIVKITYFKKFSILLEKAYCAGTRESAWFSAWSMKLNNVFLLFLHFWNKVRQVMITLYDQKLVTETDLTDGDQWQQMNAPFFLTSQLFGWSRLYVYRVCSF